MLHYPVLNSSLSADEKELIYHSDHNIGVAMDTPKGLLVPVVKRVQDKCIVQIAKVRTYHSVVNSSYYHIPLALLIMLSHIPLADLPPFSSADSGRCRLSS